MTDPTVQAVRAFNRFYTRQIGVLGEKHLESPFSLTETRVLYELAHRDRPTASEIARELGLDAGYLSRILLRFEKQRLVARQRSAIDARQSHLQLTAAGRKAFAPLDRGASRQVDAMLDGLSDGRRAQLVGAMRRIEELLAPRLEAPSGFVLRGHRPGDMGWVVHRHGVLYAEEYGWDERFEALVAEIAARFIQNFDAKRERCWIAEKGGAIVGSVFLVRASDDVAKLRLLLVEPWARGTGLGRRLVEECIGFARECGYRKITLWTQEVLHAARHIYEKTGFRVVGQERQRLFGPEMTAETWECEL
jgi:DNA-binding MarR family transcriptional regulator/N-acetylglutamate synthase-like GNAT family acetyltransferase